MKERRKKKREKDKERVKQRKRERQKRGETERKRERERKKERKEEIQNDDRGIEKERKQATPREKEATHIVTLLPPPCSFVRDINPGSGAFNAPQGVFVNEFSGICPTLLWDQLWCCCKSRRGLQQ